MSVTIWQCAGGALAPHSTYSKKMGEDGKNRLPFRGHLLVADGYAVSFMKRPTNAGTPSNKARYAYGSTMGARVLVSVP
jgi:hypothetical protein